MIDTSEPYDFIPDFRCVGCVCKYEDNFLLLKRSDKTSFPSHWGIPSGKIQEHELETEIDAIIRELEEETSISISKDKLEFVNQYYISNNKMAYVYILYILDLELIPVVNLNIKEHVDYKWLNFVDLKDFLLIPYVEYTVKDALYVSKFKKEEFLLLV